MLHTSPHYCIASMLWPGYGGILTRATLLMILVMARGLHLQISINNNNCVIFVNFHIPFCFQWAFCSIAKSLKDILPFSSFDRSSQFVSVAPCLTWSLQLWLHLLRLIFAHFWTSGSTSIWTIVLALYKIRCGIIPCHVCAIYSGLVLYSVTYVLVHVCLCACVQYIAGLDYILVLGMWTKNQQCTLWPLCSSFVWSQVHGVQKNQIFQRLMSTLFLQRAGGNFILILVQSLFVTACMSHCIFPTVHCLKYAFPTGVNISQRK